MRRKLVFKIRDFEEWYIGSVRKALDTESYLSIPLFFCASPLIIFSTAASAFADDDSLSYSKEYDQLHDIKS